MVGERWIVCASLLDPRKFLRTRLAAACAPFAITGITVYIERTPVYIERAVIACAHVSRRFSIPIDRRAVTVGVGRVRAAEIARLEQGIGLQRVSYEGFDFKIGQRKQLDRLLQLRRHHQRLGLA